MEKFIIKNAILGDFGEVNAHFKATTVIFVLKVGTWNSLPHAIFVKIV